MNHTSVSEGRLAFFHSSVYRRPDIQRVRKGDNRKNIWI